MKAKVDSLKRTSNQEELDKRRKQRQKNLYYRLEKISERYA